ncbi:oligopeptide/dipeptide ABC transporter ATP-binding protein [Merdimonas faecis]|uniref:ABC transporter ATP-binding protein n=1 Tax=Merdimonas faecis TaxID=1653435 RepID=UPI00320B06B3
MENKTEILLEVKELKKYFPMGRKTVLKAVDGVSFDIKKGETLGVVGESGCGKTTCGRTCIGLYDKTDGEVIYRGKDVHRMTKSERQEFTKNVQIIFQDPYASLDPKMKVLDIIAEGIYAHGLLTDRQKIKEKAEELLETVGLNKSFLTRYVHEFSGGQRQRIGIARALAVDPEFIVCDEPISALDVSVQAQIVNLLEKLQQEKHLTYMFIAHDLSMVKHISDRVMVMYLGQIMEITSSEELYRCPMHPYTKVLLSAIPIPDPKVEAAKKRIRMEGEIPSPVNPPEGCRFQSRCKYATEECRTKTPMLRELVEGHFVACHYPERAE